MLEVGDVVFKRYHREREYRGNGVWFYHRGIVKMILDGAHVLYKVEFTNWTNKGFKAVWNENVSLDELRIPFLLERDLYPEDYYAF